MEKFFISLTNISFFLILYIVYLFNYDILTITFIILYVVFQLIIILLHYNYIYVRNALNLFDGLLVVLFGVFLHSTIAALITYYNNILIHERFWAHKDVPEAFLLLYLSFLSIQIGYYSLSFRQRVVIFKDKTLSEFRLIIFLFIIVIYILFFLFEGLSNNTNFHISGTINYIFFPIIFAIPYFLILLKSDKKAFDYFIIFMGLFITVYISLYFRIGSKAGLVNIGIAYLVYRNYFIEKISFIRAGIFFSLAVIVMFYINYFRSIGYFSNISFADLNPFINPDTATIFWQSSIGSLSTPFEALLVTINHFPDVTPFQYGIRVMEDFIYPLWPRDFWPDKPSVYGAATMWQDVASHFNVYEDRMYESISLPGHFYQDFGWVGTILSGLLLGMSANYIYFNLAFKNYNKASIALYSFTLINLLLASRAFPWTTITVLTYVILPALLINLLLKKKRDEIS